MILGVSLVQMHIWHSCRKPSCSKHAVPAADAAQMPAMLLEAMLLFSNIASSKTCIEKVRNMVLRASGTLPQPQMDLRTAWTTITDVVNVCLLRPLTWDT